MGILENAMAVGIEVLECGEPLIFLNDNELVLDPKYFEWGFSDDKDFKIRKNVYERLLEAKKNLRDGWNLKIWDGFRTLETQKKLYDEYFERLSRKNPGLIEDKIHESVRIFVSPPSRDLKFPSPHNTGGAIDLTLVDENGIEVEMGTKFDEFDVRSFTNHFADDKDCAFHRNRMLLKEAMGKAGFVNYPEEWWHFSYGDLEWARQTLADFAIYGSMEL